MSKRKTKQEQLIPEHEDGSSITLSGLQIKSLEKAQRLAAALDIVEVECGIRTVRITIVDCFLCSNVDMSQLDRTPMERLLREIFAEHECALARINGPPWSYPDWVTANDILEFERKMKEGSDG